MIVKVNRANSIKEIQMLLSKGVDIIGISVKLTPENLDSRALRIDEIQSIKEQIDIPNLSLNLNINEYSRKDIIRIAKVLKPNSLNLFIEASHLINANDLNDELLNTIQTVNESKLNIISFGNGFGYDGPWSIPDTLRIYENLILMEVNIDSLGLDSPHRIKSRKEYEENMQDDEQKLKGTNSYITLETIMESMKDRPFLVDDKYIDTVSMENLIKIGAKGISLSINTELKNKNKETLTNENFLANMFELDKILEITKRIKEYRS